MPRSELVDSPENRRCTRYAGVVQIGHDGGGVHLGTESRMLPERLEFGAEQQQSSTPGPVERLDSDTVTDQPEPAVPAIPESESEHAGALLESFFDTPCRARLQQHFSVRMAPKVHLRQVSGHLAGIVDFSVVGDDEAAVCAHHRLDPAEITQIDDRQPTMTECDPGLRVDPRTDIVGTAVGDGVGHGTRLGRKAAGVAARGRGQNSCYSAHWPCVPLPSLK